MKIGKVSVKNFGSYKELEFDFSNLGLILINGNTGVGKSSLLDAVSWTIFGITSKEDSADAVKAWDAEGPTEGTAEVDGMEIRRTRGGNKNDLSYTERGTSKEVRGKDLTETQKLIEKRLGCTSELFLVGSYLTQFSKADSFFIAKAKDRRAVLENIADQEFAINLGEKASEARKEAKKEKDSLDLQISKNLGIRSITEQNLKSLLIAFTQWGEKQTKKIEELEKKSVGYEEERERKIALLVDALEDMPIPYPDAQYVEDAKRIKSKLSDLKADTCPTCGAASEHKKKDVYLQQLQKTSEDRANNYNLIKETQQIKAKLAEIQHTVDNPYVSMLKDAKEDTNPFLAQIEKVKHISFEAETKLVALNSSLEANAISISQLSWLYDKSFELRSLLMARVVAQIETATNKYLERFFDAALRVKFVLADSDKLDVEIHNNGFPCGFKALSGGERTMLKLAFSLSLMRAAQDKAGIHFNMIMLDEPFNGLSDSLKVKAFGLLQQLETEYESVLVIDHSSELKNQFDRTFVVDKSSGHSEIHESKTN
jgi:DNA repair exonuclease SbcCD ATPase subunit